MILAELVEISSHPRDETLKLALVIVHLAFFLISLSSYSATVSNRVKCKLLRLFSA